MRSDSPALQQFLNTWVAEFGRAIEMVTGQQPSLTFSMTDAVSIPREASAVWLKQVFSGENEFEIWIGAQDATWMEVGKPVGGAPPDNLRSRYLEMVKQAQQGAATVASSGLPTAIRCGAPETLSGPGFDPDSFFICNVELIGAGYAPIVIAVQDTALNALETASFPNGKTETRGAVVKRSEVPDLHRMADLSLPVSVSLGSISLEIKTALQARAGSVIALSKDAYDHVELLVGGVIVARGELVLVRGNYGFRIRQIVTKSQRISLCGD
jgi:flagellar motor switch/type III secretory pathway protein FliN